MADNKRVKQMSQTTKKALAIDRADGNLWLTFDKAFLDRMLKEAAEVYDENERTGGDKDYVGKGYMFKVNLDIDEFNLGKEDGNGFSIDMSSSDGSSIWMRIDLDLTPADYVTMANLVVKRINKAKALFETIK